MGFCTIYDMEQFLQLSIATVARIAAAEAAISAATAAIQGYCRQLLTYVADDELTLDSLGGTQLILPELPVNSVASVVEDGETLTVSDDYKLGQHGILHRIGGRWAKGVQIITVTYTHGYRQAGDGYTEGQLLPDLIGDICTRAAARAYQAGLRAEEAQGIPGVQGISLGDYSATFGSEQSSGAGEAVLGASASPLLLRSEKELLNRYRV